MDKKRSNRFTISFNPLDKQQELAINILNSLPQRTKAAYVAQAICAFEKRSKTNASINNQEKRGRGRPPKVKTQPESVQTEKVVVETKQSVSSSSSHIRSEKTNTVPKTFNNTVSGDMVDSMMDFLNEQS